MAVRLTKDLKSRQDKPGLQFHPSPPPQKKPASQKIPIAYYSLHPNHQPTDRNRKFTMFLGYSNRMLFVILVITNISGVWGSSCRTGYHYHCNPVGCGCCPAIPNPFPLPRCE
ncbi:hypothetical protein Pst134EA_030318 [Puccinia striiformis f. sp. tritici]|uniref:hypothetical protein n=1 Tax=Puccinia striiformis f. sp. tritici TaxID=168172 RepID=UPI002007A5F8|nr:hypothetical protein Pst134EA_030318 [Puccinia striiformis f. sp. tritici]KAH9446398.1 hypothetical protein Pst134EA_030318 [Puccinia striiformis f. sp. tritici]